jgi:hypothetical protein
MATPVTNFGKVTVSIGYASGATSIVLTTGHGSRLPSTFPFPLTWWNSTDFSDPADDPSREIVIVTARTGDTLTVTRAAESTSASNKNTASKTYKMLLGITKAMWDALGDLSLAQTFRNLSFGTHPDSDVDDKKVRLFHADAIEMSDGEEVSDWDNIDADITATTGIGGLDTGVEVVSTWLKAHAMWNGTTRGLMLQRAKNFKIDTEYITGEDASQGLRSNVDNSTVRIAQGLQFATAGKLVWVNVKLLKTGSPTGNYWLTLEASSAGNPSNTPLVTSDKYDASRLTTTATWVRIPFRTPYSVSTSTQYHLVLYGDFTVSGANYINWRMDGSAGAYASGSKALFDSDTSTWTTDTDDDMQFSAFVEENDTALVVPTGYRTAHIGWVRNDSGGNFIPFMQTGRTHQLHNTGANGQIVNELGGAPTLIDLRDFAPPVPSVRLHLHPTGTGAAIGQASLGDIRATDLVDGTLAGTAIRLRTDNTSETVGPGGTLLVSNSALIVDGTSGADLYTSGFTFE